MFSRSTWQHLRIPFSYYLLPVYLFSLSASPNLNQPRLFWVFIIVHLFLYPASNGFNSYFDKDEQSIGGLKKPQRLKRGWNYLSWFLIIMVILLGLVLFILVFALCLLFFVFVSKAYVNPPFSS